MRQRALRTPASCRLLVQGALWESDPSCANGHLLPLVSTSLAQPPLLILLPWYACPCSLWLALLLEFAHLHWGMTPFMHWHKGQTARGLWSGTHAAITTSRVTSAYDASILPTSSFSASTRRARWMAHVGKITLTVSRYTVFVSIHVSLQKGSGAYLVFMIFHRLSYHLCFMTLLVLCLYGQTLYYEYVQRCC